MSAKYGAREGERERTRRAMCVCMCVCARVCAWGGEWVDKEGDSNVYNTTYAGSVIFSRTDVNHGSAFVIAIHRNCGRQHKLHSRVPPTREDTARVHRLPV